MLLEGGPRVLPAFPDPLRDAPPQRSQRLGVEVRTGARSRGIDARRGLGSAASRSRAHRALGGRRRAPRRSAATLGVPLDRAGRVMVEPDLSIPGHPEVFVIGDLAAFIDEDGSPLPGLAPVAMQQGARGRAHRARRLAGEPRRAVPLPRQGHMATIGRAAAVAEVGRLRLAGLARLARLAVRAHLLPDRLPQPLPRALPVGVGVLQLAARRAPDHRALALTALRASGAAGRGGQRGPSAKHAESLGREGTRASHETDRSALRRPAEDTVSRRAPAARPRPAASDFVYSHVWPMLDLVSTHPDPSDLC